MYPKYKFVLVTTQRTGSTWIVDTLNSHPRVIAYSELFLRNPDKIYPEWGHKEIVLWEHFSGSLRQYMDRIFLTEEKMIDVVGFKIMYDQIFTKPWVFWTLVLRKPTFVHLIRNNVIDVVLSKELLKKHRFAHTSGKKQPHRTITLNPYRFLTKLHIHSIKVLLMQFFIKLLATDYIEVSYEDMLDDKQGFQDLLKKILPHYESHDTMSSMRKLNESSHRNRITNFDDVKKVVQGSKYEKFLRT